MLRPEINPIKPESQFWNFSVLKNFIDPGLPHLPGCILKQWNISMRWTNRVICAIRYRWHLSNKRVERAERERERSTSRDQWNALDKKCSMQFSISLSLFLIFHCLTSRSHTFHGKKDLRRLLSSLFGSSFHSHNTHMQYMHQATLSW